MRIKHVLLLFGKKLLQISKKYPNLSSFSLYIILQAGISLYFHFPYYEKGVVLEVLDGDTVVFQNAKKEKFRIRLLYIDAPELDQRAVSRKGKITKVIKTGEISKKHLKTLIGSNKKVKVRFRGEGFYGRKLGVIYKEEVNINLQMLKDGMAHFYGRGFPTKHIREVFHEAYQYAKRNKKGVWSYKKNLTPSYWRRIKKKTTKQT